MEGKYKMLGLYHLIRLIICSILFILLKLMFKKINKLKKYYNKKTLQKLLSTSVLIFLISLWINIENLFLEFNSPELAYYYFNGLNKIYLKVDGRTTTLLVCKNDEIDIVLKNSESKWKIRNDHLSHISSESYRYNNNVTITNYKYNNEVYIEIFVRNKNNITISDNRNTNFILKEGGNSKKGYNYYGYIKDFDDDYVITIL